MFMARGAAGGVQAQGVPIAMCSRTVVAMSEGPIRGSNRLVRTVRAAALRGEDAESSAKSMHNKPSASASLFDRSVSALPSIAPPGLVSVESMANGEAKGRAPSAVPASCK